MTLKVDLKFASRTHPGMVRDQNEDAIALLPESGLVILADGMGGYNAGEIASGMVTGLLKKDLEADLAQWHKELTQRSSKRLHQLLQARVNHANTAIFEASQMRPEFSGMGTTVVLALFREESITVAHVGDSRAYRLRGNQFAQLTRDHSLLQDQIDAGLVTTEQAKISLNKNLLTRAVGVDPVVDAEIRDYEIHEGDVYLFCSDGLTDMMADADILQLLQLWVADLEVAADKLIQKANENGGRDNVSVVLVQIPHGTGGKKSTMPRLMSWLK